MLIKFNAKAQGKSHIEKGIPCQDAVNARLGKNNTVGMAFVADGHGGSKYCRSQTGSALAVTVSMKSMADFYGKITQKKSAFFNKTQKNDQLRDREIAGHLEQLESNIIYNWQKAVTENLSKNPLSDPEKEICKANNISYTAPKDLILLYGTTLLAALFSGSFWFVLQIGDGLCTIIKDDGNVIAPITEDERLAFGRTTSLCDTDAINNFRENFGFNKIKGITLATDGVADSFEPAKYLQFNKELYEKFIKFPDDAEKELNDFLPGLSEKGSGDDVAIAGIFDINKVGR
jgi:serine/threonine protein phosphatase PrpC